MKSKTTRRALLSSCIALMLCFSMLLGTTYAWFTDSVTSANNIIVAGNLDVELEYKKVVNGVETEWATVQGKDDLFDRNALWEPGHVEVVYLKVSNLGTLALKYQLGVNVASEVGSKNVKGDDFKLSDHLVFKAIESDTFAPYSNREAVELAAGTELGLKEYNGKTTKLEVSGEDYVALVVYMPTTVGNEANYGKGEVTPTINLGVNVFATQVEAEFDSFGNDYDEGLNPGVEYLFSGKDIHDSSINSGKFELSADIKTSDYGDDARYGYGYEYIIRNGADYTLDLNGKTIIHDTVNENANKNALTYLFVANNAGTKLTINGDGEVYSYNSAGYACAVQGKDGTEVTINGGDYQVDNGIAVWAGAGSHMVINGGSFINQNATTDHELIYSSGGIIDIRGGFFHNKDGNYTLNIEDRNRATGFINVYGGTFVNFDPSTGGQDPNNIKVAEGYEVISKQQDNGEIWYTVVPDTLKGYTPVFEVKDLTEEIEDNKPVVLVGDIKAEPNTETLLEATSSINFNGNGKTITTQGTGTAAGESYDYGYVGFIPAKGADATVENVKVVGSGFVEVGHHDGTQVIGGGNYTIKNLVIEDLVATLAINNGGNNIAAAFSHYGTATMTDCVMTGTTTKKDGYKPYDAAFVNGTKTVINDGEYGVIYLANQAHVTINDAEVDVIDSCAITTRNLGKLTIGAGAKIGTINLTPGKYTPALVIEDGAKIGAIVYNDTTYTVDEWLAR